MTRVPRHVPLVLPGHLLLPGLLRHARLLLLVLRRCATRRLVARGHRLGGGLRRAAVAVLRLAVRPHLLGHLLGVLIVHPRLHGLSLRGELARAGLSCGGRLSVRRQRRVIGRGLLLLLLAGRLLELLPRLPRRAGGRT